jgi:hypothetical protein
MVAGESATVDGALAVEVVDGATAIPTAGWGGILVYEELFVDSAGESPSDVLKCPAGAMVQVVNGTDVKVKFTNDAVLTMVDETGATPGVVVGDYLTPMSSPGDADGYWAKTATAANAWLVVTAVDHSAGVVEARVNF